MKKAQTWSTDAIIATVVFITVVMSLFYILGYAAKGTRLEALKTRGERIPEQLAADKNVAFIEGTTLDQDKLASFANKTYDEIKAELGIQGDFCLHFEDEQGNIINVSPNRAAVGSSKATIGGFQCN